MDVVEERCAGVDLGKVDCKVCIRIPGKVNRSHREVRTFSTMNHGLVGVKYAIHPGQAAFRVSLRIPAA